MKFKRRYAKPHYTSRFRSTEPPLMSLNEIQYAEEHGMTPDDYAKAQEAEREYQKQIADELATKYAKG